MPLAMELLKLMWLYFLRFWTYWTFRTKHLFKYLPFCFCLENALLSIRFRQVGFIGMLLQEIKYSFILFSQEAWSLQKRHLVPLHFSYLAIQRTHQVFFFVLSCFFLFVCFMVKFLMFFQFVITNLILVFHVYERPFLDSVL